MAPIQGHINLDQAIFPEGTPGLALDSFARSALWSQGLNYRHGTGHGVGAALNVHEGPQSISPRLFLHWLQRQRHYLSSSSSFVMFVKDRLCSVVKSVSHGTTVSSLSSERQQYRADPKKIKKSAGFWRAVSLYNRRTRG